MEVHHAVHRRKAGEVNLYEYMMAVSKNGDESKMTRSEFTDIMRNGTESEKQEAIDKMLAEGYENLED